jgi:hypothetical protein
MWIIDLYRYLKQTKMSFFSKPDRKEKQSCGGLVPAGMGKVLGKSEGGRINVVEILFTHE